jgi:RNA polymerase sigma-70 factor (ECF subfamily)
MKRMENTGSNELNKLTSENVWNQFSNDLKRYIFSKVKNEENTNDILQDVFVKIHLNIAKLQKEESLKSWLFSIAHNTIMSFFNKKEVNYDSSNFILENQKETDEHDALNCLIPLINHLPEIYREPLLQSEIYGKKQSEVAQIMGLTLSTAKSRIQRGRKLLQQGFMDCCNYKLNDQGLLVGEHKDKDDCKKCS